jgi:transcriptional regulator with XRE-family HTH domain
VAIASTPYIGTFLRQHRETAGLSGEALAKAAGITQPCASQLEPGAVANPSAEVFCALTRALGVGSYSVVFERERSTWPRPATSRLASQQHWRTKPQT